MGIHESKRITFDKTDAKTWKEEVIKILKGAPFETLLTNTYENITIKPLYTKKDIEPIKHLHTLPGEKPFNRGSNSFGYTVQPWLIAQGVDVDNLETFNEEVREELAIKQKMIHFYVADSNIPSNGLTVNTKEELSQALQDIPIMGTPILVNTGANSLPFLSVFIEYCASHCISMEKLEGTVGMDPLHVLVKNANIPYSFESLYDAMAFKLLWAKEHAPQLKTIIVNSEAYHNGGASAVSELAYTLATATDYLNECIERGISIHDLAPRMTFCFSIGSHFFMEIAKLRAAKIVWATIVEAFGGSAEDQKMRIHAQTSSYTKAIYDPYVNIIRSTVESFAAAMGGIESLHVEPFDKQNQRDNRSFSRRIARNTQLILQEEALLTKVIDPCGGSYYIESITNELAEKAYKLFRQVEAKGGMLEALKSGFPQKDIEQTAINRKMNVEVRKDRIVGTNMFVNMSEQPLTKLTVKDKLPSEKKRKSLEESLNSMIANVSLPLKITRDQLLKANELEEPLKITPIKQHRLTEDFEALRLSSDHYLLKNGQRPKVGLLILGNISSSKTKSDFAKGFFEAGGFELESSASLNNVNEVMEYIHSRNLSSYVLCGRDEAYLDLFNDEFAKSLTNIRFYLIGKPIKSVVEKCSSIGLVQFIHEKTNCYETLLALQLKMGVTQNEEAN
ncbi:acyl-CoA mutase large subunit family protein [Litchfieldia salsa]|uniref:methylmalonyl-CoA mutase n=1 Tax=Litchfieldia salsa TaxID=930152 RepID=A0A1H0WHU4_9BACI|nr:acyl-CoA mutase large subunit family protein [Litchfieldia salsa]SDP90294.1 heterodimeric methylmalonyl-CoA mutase small subunit [Litchfieldia salsa]